MAINLLRERYEQAHHEKRRLVAPLLGFPGLNMTGCTIKLAQQNYGEHYKVMKALHDTFHPDILLPLMDLAVEANALGLKIDIPHNLMDDHESRRRGQCTRTLYGLP